MTTSNLLKSIPPIKTIIIFASIVLMLSSALTSYFLVRRNEPIIADLKADLQDKQTLIRDVWNNTANNETKANIAILLSTLADTSKPSITMLIDNYLANFKKLNHHNSPFEILEAVKSENQNNIEYIDNLYLEQTTIQNKINSIERSNKLYSDIAFFLQILSLTLIILEKTTPSTKDSN